MNKVLEEGILKYFSEDVCLLKIVRQAIQKLNQNDEDQPKVDRLATMAIKSMMNKELVVDEMDLRSQYIYKLIFKEPIDYVKDFGIVGFAWEPGRPYYQDCEENKINRRKAELHRMRSDGPIMFSILRQQFPRKQHTLLEILVTRNILLISDGAHYVAEIPHRDGIEFDTFWAEKFAMMIMSKRPSAVSIMLHGEGLPAHQLNREYLRDFVHKSIIDKLPRVIPPEGWEQYNISEERPVFSKSCFEGNIEYDVAFEYCTEFDSHYVPYYWSCCI